MVFIYSADVSGLENNLKLLSEKIAIFFGESNYIFPDFYQLFIYFKKQNSRRKKTILVIDECSYLADASPEINFIFQKIVDEYLDNSNIKIILVGNHLGIVKSLQKYDNPLYQRISFQKQILPFDYLETSAFYPDLTSVEKIKFYSVFGVMPFVLNKINPKKDLKKNISEIYFQNDDILNTDVINILGHENKRINSYVPILKFIAGKNRQIKDISSYTQKPTSVILPLINNLLEMEILKKEVSFGENSLSPKKTNYSFKDPYFNFCYYFLRNKLSEFVILDHETFFKNYIKYSLEPFIILTFKKICQTFLKEYHHTKAIQVSRYWDNNYKSKENIEIDIVLEQLNNKLIFLSVNSLLILLEIA
ncbi:AAA family ATPase ['Camptotheca acuminata' phytoplasma]|uniref:AAA family ATPase n=1 Tax='Camptotheca acuminata' phytoplasma TaxID=3239192 RepID=UPI00351A3E1C